MSPKMLWGDIPCCAWEDRMVLYKASVTSEHMWACFKSTGFRCNLNIGSVEYGGFPGGSDSKQPACNAGDLSSIPGSAGSPGEENSNLLQYSCLENPMDRGAWWAEAYGVAKSQTRQSNRHSQTQNFHKHRIRRLPRLC